MQLQNRRLAGEPRLGGENRWRKPGTDGTFSRWLGVVKHNRYPGRRVSITFIVSEVENNTREDLSLNHSLAGVDLFTPIEST